MGHFTEEQQLERDTMVKKINQLIEDKIHLEEKLAALEAEPAREQVDDIFDVMRNMSARVEALQMESVGLRQALHDQQDIIAGLETALVPVKDEPFDG